MKKSITFLVLNLCVLLSFGQKNVFMPWIEVVNLHPDYQESLTQTFKDTANASGLYHIITPEKEQITDNSVYQSPVDQAIQHQADYVLRSYVEVVNGKANAEFHLFNVNDNNLEWEASAKGQPLTELYDVICKAAKQIGKIKDIDVRQISDEMKFLETTFIRESSVALTVKLGGSQFANKDFKDQFSPGFGLGVSYDINYAVLEGNFDLYFSESKLAMYNFNVQVPVLPNLNYTPFVQAGIAKTKFTTISNSYTDDSGLTTFDRQNCDGAMFNLGGGVILFREKDIFTKLTVTKMIGSYKVFDKTLSGYNATITACFKIKHSK